MPFRLARRKGRNDLLEPIYETKIATPEEFMGDVKGNHSIQELKFR
jgi:translation elongation factor EF-G